VLPHTVPHGLAPLSGSSPHVGVVGYTLGGAVGPLGRCYGFAADRVRRVDIVCADGQLRQVTADSEPELFWAVRGGQRYRAHRRRNAGDGQPRHPDGRGRGPVP
jgi:FAD/FMN-containing dehydrogenase